MQNAGTRNVYCSTEYGLRPPPLLAFCHPHRLNFSTGPAARGRLRGLASKLQLYQPRTYDRIMATHAFT